MYGTVQYPKVGFDVINKENTKNSETYLYRENVILLNCVPFVRDTVWWKIAENCFLGPGDLLDVGFENKKEILLLASGLPF